MKTAVKSLHLTTKSQKNLNISGEQSFTQQNFCFSINSNTWRQYANATKSSTKLLLFQSFFRHRRQFVKWHYKRAAKKRQLTICIHFLWCTLFSIHSSRMKIFCELFYVACTLHRVQNSSVFLKLTKVNHKRKRQSVSHKRTKKTWRKRMTGDW